jgi:hypothetical protein
VRANKVPNTIIARCKSKKNVRVTKQRKQKLKIKTKPTVRGVKR